MGLAPQHSSYSRTAAAKVAGDPANAVVAGEDDLNLRRGEWRADVARTTTTTAAMPWGFAVMRRPAMTTDLALMPATAGAIAAAAGFDHGAWVAAGGAGGHCGRDLVLWIGERFKGAADDVFVRSVKPAGNVIQNDQRLLLDALELLRSLQQPPATLPAFRRRAPHDAPAWMFGQWPWAAVAVPCASSLAADSGLIAANRQGDLCRCEELHCFAHQARIKKRPSAKSSVDW